MPKDINKVWYIHVYIAIYSKPYSGVFKKIYPDLDAFKIIIS